MPVIRLVQQQAAHKCGRTHHKLNKFPIQGAVVLFSSVTDLCQELLVTSAVYLLTTHLQVLSAYLRVLVSTVFFHTPVTTTTITSQVTHSRLTTTSTTLVSASHQAHTGE